MKVKQISLFAVAALLVSLFTMPTFADYDKETIQTIQQALNSAGFDCGTPDGIAGKGTAAAISAFQEANGLTVDGQISDELMKALGLLEETAGEERAPETTSTEEKEVEQGADSTITESTDGVDYLVLVNKDNKIPDNWEEKVSFVSEKSVPLSFELGQDIMVEAETETMEQFNKLREALLEEDIDIILSECYVSEEMLQRTWDNSLASLGEEYTKEHVEVPGYSEMQTGLAIEFDFMQDDGTPVIEKDFMLTYKTGEFEIIHEKLPEYGFIVRYPEGKEDITGHDYEPWHIRYVGSPEVAKEITEQGLTLEEYLAK